jgi:hypothetical protein
MIPDSDDINFNNEPKENITDKQKNRYKKRFERHIVDVEEVTGRVLSMCGKTRIKSEKAKVYNNKVSFTSEMLTTDDELGSKNDMVRIAQMVGHL